MQLLDSWHSGPKHMMVSDNGQLSWQKGKGTEWFTKDTKMDW
jgi:hypothetical protein